MSNHQIKVKSHVARDLLQSAALFKTDKLVIWEYVSNGLQYVDPGVAPHLKVTLDAKKKCASINDNGRGMAWADLNNFFLMHGENLDRKAGRAGRGRFGTGKSAAFGIADMLRLTTTRNGKRSSVELSRKDIETMPSGEGIPVRTLEKEIPTSAPNGTLIEIEGINLRTLDQPGVIHYIERHLARWPKNVIVWVNNHQCEYNEPAVAREEKFNTEGAFQSTLGDVELTIKAAKAPLEEDQRGISIYANGVWYETTLAGSENKEMAQYIFGEIDVPRLDEDTSIPAPFDMSRTMQLNTNNQLVQMIYAFIGQKVEYMRRDLVETERERKASEEAKKLDKQAQEIAQVINEDFNHYRQRVVKAKARAGLGADVGSSSLGGEKGEDVLWGDETPAEVVSPTGSPGHQEGDGSPQGEEPRLMNPVVEVGRPDSPKQGKAAGGRGNKAQPRGGFAVKFAHMGPDECRAKYQRDERTIYVNLDHPQLVAARALGSTEEPTFRRLSYEVAFAEYAIALSTELAARDEYLDPSDAIVDIRDTLNRVARKGAALYAR
jgi:hypothetical protein